jgi:hypothetical protein
MSVIAAAPKLALDCLSCQTTCIPRREIPANVLTIRRPAESLGVTQCFRWLINLRAFNCRSWCWTENDPRFDFLRWWLVFILVVVLVLIGYQGRGRR